MNIFKKLLKIGQAEIHALVVKMENPITLIEQGIRDLQEQMALTKEQYAQVRAVAIRTENILNEKMLLADEYEQKAKRVLEKVKDKEIESAKADRLALEALTLKKELIAEAKELRTQIIDNEHEIKEINNKFEVLRFNISKWEKELITLKTKKKIADVSLLANKQMSNIDSNSTIEMLERLKNKAKDEQALAQAYGELAKDELDEALDNASQDKDDINNELDLLKQNLGIK